MLSKGASSSTLLGMGSRERVAAITGIWVAVAAVTVLSVIYPWFRDHLADLQWVMGMVSGWVLCTLVNRDRR